MAAFRTKDASCELSWDNADPEAFIRNTGAGLHVPMSAAKFRKAQGELFDLDAILSNDSPSKAELQQKHKRNLEAFGKRQQFFRDICAVRVRAVWIAILCC